MIAVAHRSADVAAEWVEALGALGHLARVMALEPLPERPTVLDAVLVDPAFPAAQVEALRTWAGRVEVRLTERIDADWLNELVRTSAEPLQLGSRRVDLRRGVVDQAERIVALTDTEALLLASLASHAPTVVSRGDLLQRVWGYHPDMRTRVVDVTVARLRAKIEDDASNPAFLVTVRGKGYRLEGLERATPPAPAPSRPRDDGLVGRQKAWKALERWMQRGDPVLTVLGPPGIGKTALATAFAEALPNASIAHLQAAETDDEALSVVAAALGLPAATTESAAIAAISRGERGLLVLDNAEHVLGFVGRLLATPPRSPVLVTSRVRLSVPEERCFDLEPLSSDATQALFLECARRLRADFTDDPRVLTELATLCEGLPLAVELAAAQVRVLSGVDLVRVLGRRGVRSKKRVGHQSYDEALDSSWSLLDEEERQLLGTLAVVRGAVPLALVEALHPEPLEALGGLADASLVQIRHGPDGANVHLLETVRRYVSTHHGVAAEPEVTLLERAAGFLQEIDARAMTEQAWAALRALDTLRLTVSALADRAIERERPDLAVKLALSMRFLFHSMGSDPASLALFRRVEAAAGEDERVAIMLEVASMLRMQGLHEEATRKATRCAELADDPATRAEVEVLRTKIAHRQGDLATAPLAAVIDDLPDGHPRWSGLAILGLVHTRRMETAAAIDALQRSLAIADRMGVAWIQASSLWILSSAYHAAGEVERTVATVDLYLKTAADAPDRHREMRLSVQLTAARVSGSFERAAAIQSELVDIMREQGRTLHQAWSTVGLGGIHVYQGDLDAAERAARDAERLYRSIGNDTGLARAAVLRGAVALARGALQEAEDLVCQGLTAPQPVDRHRSVELTVWTALIRGDLQGARDVLTNVDLPAALAGLLEGLVNAVSGAPVGPVVGDTDVRRALAMKLGGPTVPIRTARGRAILAGTSTGYPESALVALLGQRSDP